MNNGREFTSVERAFPARTAAAAAGMLLLLGVGVGLAQEMPGDPTVDRPAVFQLTFGPVDGFTTAPHPARTRIVAPIGVPITFGLESVLGSSPEDEIDARWEGDALAASFGAVATYVFEAGAPTRVAVVILNTGQRCECTVTPIDIRPEDLLVEYSLSAPPVELDEDATNEQTVAAYFDAEPYAPLDAIDGGYVTSIGRTIHFDARSSTVAAAPAPIAGAFTVATPIPQDGGPAPQDKPADRLGNLVEWRLNGEAFGLGRPSTKLDRPGVHRVAVGPPRFASEFDLVTYRVRIRSEDRRGDYPQDTPITFTATTVPGGYEDHITWLSSTTYGSAEPTLGYGSKFTVVFSNTFGPHPSDGSPWQWLGVRAGDTERGQDQKIRGLINKFKGTDAGLADDAYIRLFHLGADAIGPLLTLTNDTSGYAGTAFINPISSVGGKERPQVRLVAIYLIDGILYDNPTPHFWPEILGDGVDPNDPTNVDLAIPFYLSWWDLNQGQPLSVLRTLPFPLAPAPLAWFGPLLNPAPVAPAGTGTKVPNSETPAKHRDPAGADGIPGNADDPPQPDGPDAGGAGDPYAWEFPPSAATGPTPYNCFAWAMNCSTDRWIWPAGGKSWKDILDDYGYASGTVVACGGQCPATKGPKVKLIFHEITAGALTVQKLVHVMKQEADGDWSSKNGQSSRWKDITDCQKFLDKHYPVPAGQTRVLKCFCKN